MNTKETIAELMLGKEGENTYIDDLIKSNYEDRKIVLNDEISESLLYDVVLPILKYNKEDKGIPIEQRKKIFLYLNTAGGDVLFGMNIVDVIKNSKTPVVTVAFASSMSMGLYILAAGHERYCFPESVIVLHDGGVSIQTSSNKAKDIHKFYERADLKLETFLVENTKMTKEYLESVKDRESYFFGDEAKDLGIVDKLIGIDADIYDIL